ncbi:hypothetical protein Gohar_020138, partial [Gossypium harknessii]|nr:hypothetical protein [Gossypium harknessii]
MCRRARVVATMSQISMLCRNEKPLDVGWLYVRLAGRDDEIIAMQIYYRRRLYNTCKAAFSTSGPVSDEALERVRTML